MNKSNNIEKADNYRLSDYILHGIFFLFFGLVKYIPSPIGDFLRNIVAKIFLSSSGKLRVYEGVVFWYPYRINLGNRVTINEFCYLNGYGGLDIGNDVLIAHRVSINTSEHIFSKREVPIKDQGVYGKKVVICNNVWIGANVTILAGITIGEGAVVAAGAVVASDVEPFSVVGGVPAKKISTRPE